MVIQGGGGGGHVGPGTVSVRRGKLPAKIALTPTL